MTKYGEMEMRQKQLEAALDHAHQEMFEYKSKQDDVTSARSSEVDILNQDLERANEVRASPLAFETLDCPSSERRTRNA